MSAFMNPLKGCVFVVFEVCPIEGLRYLAFIERNQKRNKVIVRAKVQPIRKTKGDHCLVVYCVPVAPTVRAIQNLVESLLEVVRRVAQRVEVALAPMVGKPNNDETRTEAKAILNDVFTVPSYYVEIEPPRRMPA